MIFIVVDTVSQGSTKLFSVSEATVGALPLSQICFRSENEAGNAMEFVEEIQLQRTRH